MSSKIRIKIGEIEVDYEGAEEFLKKELLDLLKALAELHEANPHAVLSKQFSGSPELKLSISSIASKLGVKKGPELILAACAHIALVQGKTAFDQKDILTEMKKAAGYFKQSYMKNLTNYLRALVKNGTLTEPTSGTYSIFNEKLTEIRTKLS
jgi:hypothetical protein